MTRLEKLIGVRDRTAANLEELDDEVEQARHYSTNLAIMEIAIGLEQINAQLTNIGFELSGMNR